MKTTNNIITVFRMNLRQAWYHKHAATASVLSWALRMGLTILLYYFIYKLHGNSAVNGVTFQIAASSMILYGVFVGFGYRDLFKIINREFKTGNIELWLNKPASYLQLKTAEVYANNIPVVFGLVITAAIFWIFSGQFPQVNNLPLVILASIPILVLGLVIATLIYLIIGLSVVWLLESQPLFLIVDKLIMIFGGAFIPVGFFPTYIRLFGELLPTGAAMYFTQTFYTNFLDNFPRFIAVQIFWIVVLGFSVLRMSRAANNKLTVNGG